MRKASLPIAATFGIALLGSAAQAGIQVLGNSVGHSCYVSATTRSGSTAAIRDCDDALASGVLSAGDEVATYVNRGIVKIYAGDLDSAIADFDRAIRLDPTEPESYLNKGSAILRSQGSAADAIALFDEALAHNTRRPELAHYARAVAYETSGNLNAAYRDYRRAHELAPRWEEPARELSRFRVRNPSSPR
jgi:tetratricopeptide (TPR) repeat protein